MSKAYRGKTAFRRLYDKLFGRKNKIEYVKPNQLELENNRVNSIISGVHNRTTDYIFALISLAMDSRAGYAAYFQLDVPMKPSEYLYILSKAELLPYGENIMHTINSIAEFSFEFVDHKDDSGIQQKFCITRLLSDNSVFAAFQVTSNKDEYKALDDFLRLCDECINSGFDHYAYRHICGIILNYMKIHLTRFTIPENGMVYIMKEHLGMCRLVNIDDWLNENKVQEI